MKARDLMSQPVRSIGQDDSLEAAARLMVDHDVGCLPVVDGDGRLVGVLTPSDFVAKEHPIPFSAYSAPQVLGHWLQPSGLERIYRTARALRARDAMSTPPFALPEEASLEQVLRIMLERRVHHVLIVRDRRPVGIISRADLLRLFLRDQSE